MTNLTTYKKEVLTEFDIKQRLFLNGKYHSTQFNKWFEEQIDSLVKEIEEAVVPDEEALDPHSDEPFGWNKCREEVLTALKKFRGEEV